MLRTRSGLPRSVAKWTAQVAASIGATLVASMVYAVLPKPALPEAPRAELTSGGKFAARAVVPAAYDGLDTMPLPHVAPRPVLVQASAEAPAVIRRVAFEAPIPPVAAPARPGRTAHAPVKLEAHRVAAAAEPPPRILVATAERASDVPAPEAAQDEGFLHRMVPRIVPAVVPAVVSTARAAWSMTASASEALVDRVVPQMP